MVDSENHTVEASTLFDQIFALLNAKADDIYPPRLRWRIEHFTAWLTCCCSRDVRNSNLTQDLF